MALATTCPQCKTSFKVVPDQLKLRRGLVRCGVCQHVFSGIDHLRYVDDAARAAQRAARERAASGAMTSGGAAGMPVTAQGDASAARAAGPLGTQPVAPATSVGAPLDRARPADDPEALPARATDGPGDAPPDRAPADPWAAAAAIAHERSLRDDAADRATGAPRLHQVPAPAAPDAPTPMPIVASARTAMPQAADVAPPPPLAAAPSSEPSSASAPPASDAPPVPAPPSADAPAAPGTSTPPWAAPPATSPPTTVQAAAPHPTRPALPAPDAARVSLDDLLARPAAPWPPAAGPQTILAADDDLKTAFFLTDSSFGPLPGETSDMMPPTSIHRPGAHAETVTRPHGEAPSAAPTPVPDAPRGAAPALPALPGLPLRPERGTPEDTIVATPASVPVPPPPFEPAPRRADPPPAEPVIDDFPGPRRRSRSLGLALSPAAWVAAVGLSLLLGLQAVVGWRDTIAARAPLFAPTLADLLGPFGLEVRPPREIDALTIEGFELQASGTPNVLTLSAVLRNRSAHVVGYPAMELTLTDSAGALIVRKVIPPDLYVADVATIEAGLAARTERPLRLALQHDGLQPTGFAVSLFYP
jgi:predicted Zn finger-like uncharacterized protein